MTLRQWLPAAYPITLASRALSGFFGSRAPQLRVLLYHDVAPNELDSFKSKLIWLKARWKFLSPYKFEQVIRGERELDRDSVLLTFDDGFHSNRVIAEKILEPLGIQAIFFVVTNFIDQQDLARSRDFICQRLGTSTDPKLLPLHQKNMSWKDLRGLNNLGHTIGAHTKSHERLLPNIEAGLMYDEIIGSANRLEQELSTKIKHFAFPYGNFSSISRSAIQLALIRYEFIHSSLRGNNRLLKSPGKIIRRESLKPTDSNSLVGALLYGAADYRYRAHNDVLDQWAS